MYTVESFCQSVWETSFIQVSKSVCKEDYKKFAIPKKNGFRQICFLPLESKLLHLQKKLLASFLEKQMLPTCVKGFRKGENYITYIRPHVNSCFYFRTDIKDFFPSITEKLVKDTLSGMLICDSEDEKSELISLIANIVTLDGILPQGACTSPAMSNLVMARLDQRILKYCQAYNIIYTRYADDLLFSSESFDFKEKKWFLKMIKHVLGTHQFRINYSKNKYGSHELSLNGYIVSSTGLRLSRNRLSDIRHVCSFVSGNISLLSSSSDEVFLNVANQLKLKHRDLSRYPFQSVFQLSQYLCGYRAFLISFVDYYNSGEPFQKDLRRLIRRIEKQIELLI